MTAVLSDGQSEIDTVVFRLPDYGQEIKSWSSYNFNRAFLTPTAAWTFKLSDEDPTLTNELLVPGARVELSINGRVQCSGFIEKKSIESSAEGGTHVTIHGGDILSRVVKATMDPAFAFVSGMTVAQFILSVLDPFGISVLFNSDLGNIKVITGYEPGKGGTTTKTVPAEVVTRVDSNASGPATEVIVKETKTQIVSNTRPDLSTLTIQQAKPHAGEGCFAYLDRILKRLGLTMWAAADGSGVVVDVPNFTQPANYSIVHSRSDPSRNNVTHASYSNDIFTQPTCIVAFGFGGGQDVQKSRLKCIMINELTGLDDQGRILPSVQQIIARYKGAQVLPLRPQLSGFPKPLGDSGTAMPLFLKDDEAKNPDQLAAFVRREMARRQMTALQLTYEVVGHTQDGHPWCVNTQAAVQDEVFGVNETLWVQDVSFAKSGGGTTGSIKVIRPYTLAIGP